MIVKVADHIISPLGLTSEDNYREVKAGKSALRLYENHWEIPEPFTASLFEDGVIDQAFAPYQKDITYTPFEKLIIYSVSKALEQTNIDVTSTKVQFLLSTTKGNVSLLDANNTDFPKERALLGIAAKYITNYFQNPNQPIVISNACISGVCAQITAMRLLESGECETAIVVGCDIQSRFIVSGFQSFKALSPIPCKPFDAHRCGLNLGEAAATIIYTNKNKISEKDWVACKGAIRNDANHISGPSRTGEGSYRALRSILTEKDIPDLAFINSHGTSTLYNDEMESIAITRAGLHNIPVNSLKGYYGHTMGAAGILESILSMHAIDDNTILGTRGFETSGVSNPLLLSSENKATDKKAFIKLLSGFGGCNAAILFKKGELL